jgi:cation diffusion facilitator family transporter
MAREQGGEQAPASVASEGVARRSRELPMPVPLLRGPGGSESLTTVLVAFGANVLVAVAKSAAAVVTGSASLVAEAAHSWADSGNEIFLLIANRRARRPPDRAHPFGHGREAYVWSLFAALGLFVAGAAVSVTRGIQELVHPEPAERFLVGYVVLAVSFVLEGISFLQSVRQARSEAVPLQRDLIEHVMATSDPTLRAVFAEDSAALTGLVIAAAGLAAHQLTGSSVPDAAGSILVGLLLGVAAVVLINRNRRCSRCRRLASVTLVRLGMADALDPWQDDSVLNGRSRGFAMVWRPLLAEGLIDSGQTEPMAAVLDQLGAAGSQSATCSQPWPGSRDGWPSSTAIRTGPGRSISTESRPLARTARYTLVHRADAGQLGRLVVDEQEGRVFRREERIG